MALSRKLVSIMFTDIVGYTKLMQQDEKKAIGIRKRHREVIEATHQQYGGKVIQYLGDGTLSIFDSATDSVHAAVAIQTQLQLKPQVPLRIGIHLGDVMVTESDIIGNGVNLASRVESLGVAGAVLISEKVREEIRNQNIRTELMGTFHFKNDEYPRDIYAVKAPGLKVPRPESLAGKTEKSASFTNKQEKEPAEQELLSMDDRFLRSIREIILNNLTNPQFSVEVLSKEAGYSRPQLYRKVKALTNRSPTDLIRDIRLEKAAQLLRSNTGNVSEIAYETGFNNLSYFSKAFQELFGITPSEYAKGKNSGWAGPVSLTRFFGREKELKEIGEILSRVRLLTLTGTGGTGKTRLSMELLTQINNTFKNGAYFVQLAPLAEAGQVLPKIAQVLKIKQDPSKETLLSIIQWIGNREILLVLDNFEHVLTAANDISKLLLSCPALKILVTSRVVLNIAGEHEYPVPQLGVPSDDLVYTLEQLEDFSSVQLFINRSQAAKPDFQLLESNRDAIVSICRQLDGLPLALELAAARIKIFSPQALAQRLSSSLEILSTRSSAHPDRHKTLRQAIDWSYNLLSPEEQTLFRRLSVFGGGCTLDAAEQVCFKGYRENLDFLDCISSLVDKSLLYRQDQHDGEPRFYLLETLRVFGRERMEASQEKEEILSGFTAYFIEVLQTAKGHLSKAGRSSWLDKLELELDNIRAILNWAVEQQDAETGLKVATTFWRFWTIRSMMREGTQWMAKILNLPAGPDHARLRCQGLNAYGIMFILTNNIRDSIEIFKNARNIALELDYPEGLAQALNHLGWACQFDCQFESGIQYSLEAQKIYEGIDDQRGVAISYNNIAFMEFWRGDVARAAELYTQSKEIRRQIGDHRGYAFLTINVVRSDLMRGVLTDMEKRLDEAIGILSDLSDNQLWAYGILVKSEYFFYVNQLEESRQLSMQAQPLWQEVGTITGLVQTEIQLAEIRLNDNQTEGLAELLENLLHKAQLAVKYYVPKIRYAQIKLLMQEGDLREAFELCQVSLFESIELGVFLFFPDTLEVFSALCLRLNYQEAALHAFVFSEQFRKSSNILVPPVRKEFVRQIRKELDGSFGETQVKKVGKKLKDWSPEKFAENFVAGSD